MPKDASADAPGTPAEAPAESKVQTLVDFAFINPSTGELVQTTKGTAFTGPLAEYLLRADPEKVAQSGGQP